MPQQRTLRGIISARLIEARADLALFSRMAERDPYWRAEVQLAQRRIRDAEDDLQGLRRHQSRCAVKKSTRTRLTTTPFRERIPFMMTNNERAAFQLEDINRFDIAGLPADLVQLVAEVMEIHWNEDPDLLDEDDVPTFDDETFKDYLDDVVDNSEAPRAWVVAARRWYARKGFARPVTDEELANTVVLRSGRSGKARPDFTVDGVKYVWKGSL